MEKERINKVLMEYKYKKCIIMNKFAMKKIINDNNKIGYFVS